MDGLHGHVYARGIYVRQLPFCRTAATTQSYTSIQVFIVPLHVKLTWDVDFTKFGQFDD